MKKASLPAGPAGRGAAAPAGLLRQCGAQTGDRPYAFTEETKSVLEIFGMADTAALFTFQGPEEAITLRLRVETLGEDGTWREDDVGRHLHRGGPDAGGAALRRPGPGAAGGPGPGLPHPQRRPSPPTGRRPPPWRRSPTASAWVFLPESRDLPLNEKVPVALLLWSGGAPPRMLPGGLLGPLPPRRSGPGPGGDAGVHRPGVVRNCKKGIGKFPIPF